MILDGTKLSREIAADLARRAAKLHAKLCVILAGDDPASIKYVNAKQKKALDLGIECRIFRLPQNASESEILKTIHDLNSDASVHGIMAQLPLPAHLNSQKITRAIAPEKDVDGLSGRGDFMPATTRGIERLLAHYLFGENFNLDGRVAVVAGAGDVAGRPTAKMLLDHGATVIVCHKATKDLAHWTRQADILVSATGRRGLISRADIKGGAVLIDVGTTGDISRDCYEIASAYSPVPGGVGPMTIISLLDNTVSAAERR